MCDSSKASDEGRSNHSFALRIVDDEAAVRNRVGEAFVTAAPDEERKDRRVEVCSSCSGYLKTIDVSEMSPFPLLSIGDLETMDLDMAAMDHGYRKPAMKEFARFTRR